ncbi:hypothetical protein B0O80DRAFT_240830 [Mortierella sp. GBAus27b]|nr:hypothetical protein BGX31_005703 [Mortierella sp. GBA43]KAI8346397.1 hypothetical protein B0O80DRAFT_240830 [Mortierella sp. GBAus27b]
MSANDLAITTDQSAADEDYTSQAMPLSPASVRSYQKNKDRKNKKKSKDQPFSEEESEDDDDDNDDDEESYDSDKKSSEDDEDFNAAHLDPRFEALDGTTKLKTTTEVDEDDEDSSNEDDADSPKVSALREAIAGATLEGKSVPSGSGAKGDKSKSAAQMPNIVLDDINADAGELYQDPTSEGAKSSTTATADAANQGQEERLQEPVRPHIALPCLVETAKNPARTRITLKYAGNDRSEQPSSADQDKSPSRGRKNYMVATDLSGESWHATEWAITTILRNGDELNVVTIVEDDKSDNGKTTKKGVQAEMREDAEKLTKNIHEQLEHTCLRDITVVIHIIAATKAMGAKELLIEMIDDLEDLSTVIVGSRGRGAIKGLLLGSISNFLVHNSSVPVMVVRSPKKPKGKKKTRRGRIMEQSRNVREANRKYEQAFANDD